MTFDVVNRVSPRGNPSGIENPVGSKSGLLASIPSSMIPILIPSPRLLRPGRQSEAAPINAGLESSVAP